MYSVICKSEINIRKFLKAAIIVFSFGCQILHISSGYSEEQYVGCFKERTSLGKEFNESYRLLSHFVSIDDVTVQKCLDACASRYFIYAGLQYGNNCWCGDQYFHLKSDECKMPCSGNHSEMCGGQLINSVYSVCPELRYGENCAKECNKCNATTKRCYLKTGTCLPDINECEDEEIKNSCEQICNNTNLGYECVCKRGYVLQPSGKCPPLNGIPPYAVMLVVLAILIPISISANLILTFLHKVRDKKYQAKLAQKKEQEKREEDERGYINPVHEVNSNDPEAQPHLYKKLQERRPVNINNNI